MRTFPIPRIVEATAISIIVELGDIRRFESSTQIKNFIGIDIKHYKSGNFLVEEYIIKRDNPYVNQEHLWHSFSQSSRPLSCHRCLGEAKKDTRRWCQLSHIQSPLYIALSKRHITLFVQ